MTTFSECGGSEKFLVLGKARRVSKPWNSALTSPSFTKAHFKHHNVVEKPLLLLSTMDHTRAITMEKTEEYAAVTKPLLFPSEDPGNDFPTFCGSCNGLTLFRVGNFAQDGHLVVVNLTTMESFRVDCSIFKPEIIRRSWWLNVSVFGFGYDEANEDYIILVGSNYDFIYMNFTPNSTACIFYVYSLKFRFWRRISGYHGESCFFQSIPCVYFGNVMHWIGTSKTTSVQKKFSFHMGLDEIREYSLPEYTYQLFVSEGFLYSAGNKDYRMYVWRLTDHCGMDATWSRLFELIEPDNVIIRRPILILSSEGKVVFDMGSGELEVYNLQSGRYTRLLVDNSYNGHYFYAGNYIENLLSPNNI